MHILFHEQAVCSRGTKMEKGLLDSGKWNSDVALPFPGSVWNNVTTVRRTEDKETENGFLDCHVIPQVVPNWQAHFLKEMIIHRANY